MPQYGGGGGVPRVIAGMPRLAAGVERLASRLRYLSVRAGRIGAVPAAVVVAVVASINFLANLGYPPYPIWDESYYLTAVARYEERIAQFASHPPLGLQLITAGDVLLHPNRGLDTRRIGWDKKIAGEQLPKGYSFAGVRLMPGVFGALGAVLFFALMYVLTQSVLVALAFANLYVFDNAFIVHFRAAQLDPFQIAFVIGALLAFAVSARRGARSSSGVDFLLGLWCGLAAMVKLNAAVLGLLGVMLIVRRIGLGWRTSPRALLLAAAARDGMVMVGGCFAAIAVIATLHVVLNPLPPNPASPAGRKDLRYITPTYAAYLHHERPLSPAVVLDASADYLRFMFDDLKGVPRTDPNGSKPYVWPFHRGTINYRWDSTNGRTAYVQLAGNPVGWSIGLAALLGSLVLVVCWSWRAVRRVIASDRGRAAPSKPSESSKKPRSGGRPRAPAAAPRNGRAPASRRESVAAASATRHAAAATQAAHPWPRPAAASMPGLTNLPGRAAAAIAAPASDPARRAILVMLLAQYVFYMAVHAYIGVERVMYLYHYFIALVISYCLVPLVFAEAADRWPALRARQVPILATMVVLLWAAFIFYAPLTYHWYLTVEQCEWRNVLQHVVNCHR